MDDDTVGYLYTHYDCPLCGEAGETEGDASSDTVECADCGGTFTVSEVR